MPQQLKSIAFHIGPHKTATTHLQKMLENNKDMLLDHGVRFLGPKYLRVKGRNLSAMFKMSWYSGATPSRTPQAQLEFVAKGCKRLVISEEIFAGKMTDAEGRVPLPLYEFLPEKLEELAAAWAPIKPQIFLSVRNPVAFMASVYSQNLHGAPHIGPRTFRARNDWRNVDWVDFVARIRATPGIGDIVVWRQEDYAENPRPVLRKLLQWRAGGKVKLIKERVQQGLSSAAVRLTLQQAADGATGRIASQARQQFPINETNEPFKLYASSTLAQAEQIYADQVAQIAAMDGVQLLYRRKDVPNEANKG